MTSNCATQGSKERIKVLVVDDSPLMCRVIKEALKDDEEMEVVGHALNGQEALEILSDGKVDVCTLDVYMPGMNGLTVLKNIMIRFPLPTLMVSAFTADGSRITFDALRYGAVDFFQKPTRQNGGDILEQAAVLQSRVKRAARTQVEAARYLRLKPVSGPGPANGHVTNPSRHHAAVIINAGTGGYSSILSLLPKMGARPRVPLIISMGAPGSCLNAFLEYLRKYVMFDLVRAGENQYLEAGKAYFLCSDEAAILDKENNRYLLVVKDHQDLANHEGGIDLLLFSASEYLGSGTLSIFLSGDGVHGVSGAKEVIRNDGTVLVQRPETCLAPELPQKLIKEINSDVCSLNELATRAFAW